MPQGPLHARPTALWFLRDENDHVAVAGPKLIVPPAPTSKSLQNPSQTPTPRSKYKGGVVPLRSWRQGPLHVPWSPYDGTINPR